ncbi:SDR family oxidoreductase [Oceanobacter mangrovi]|uniref:SDR family oxidoreductase n=1 Tax=Oceanobacter mangrovi TaxID=2862510 RepID=UPI001C8E31A1|nr:SDR family oxidoreductase [Oceanobacter mangrovi]
MKNILIIGATSAIAQACARYWLQHSNDCHFVLTGRDQQKLAAIQSDLQIRGAVAVDCLPFDLADESGRASLLERVEQLMPQLDRVLVAPGSLPDQQRCQTDESYAAQAFQLNANAIVLLLERLAGKLEQQRSGKLIVISSVAGDRGRMSNYFYGAAKAAVTTFCSGLMMRLQKAEVSVSIVKPGFVRTPMTADLELPEKLVATPEQVARVIVDGAEKCRSVIYAPGFWLLIMTIIKLIPNFVFRRLSL